MSAKQKFQDLVLLIQKDRKTQVFAIIGVLVLGFLIFNPPKPKTRRASAPAEELGVGAQASKELYDDLKTAVVSRLDEVDQKITKFDQDLKEQKARQEESEIRTAEIFSTLIEKVNAQSAAQAQYPVGGPNGPDVSGVDIPAFNEDELQTFGTVADTEAISPIPPPEPLERTAIISTADFVRVKLLAGVNAPTDGTPYPVLFQLVGDVEGPDGSALPLGEARLMAAAQGSLTDSRALFRLTSLSMRYPNGQRGEVDVDGWIVGEDGIRGMQGVPIDPLGKVLAGGALFGVIGGIGDGLSASQTTTTVGTNGNVFQTVDGNLALSALGRGIKTPTVQWSETIQERLEELVPAIQVFSGREATAVFSKPVKIPMLYDLLNTSEYDVYAPLD